MAIAAEMDAVSFMLEIIRMEDWELVACMSRFTTMIERQHSTHPGPGRLFYVSMDVTKGTACHVAKSTTVRGHFSFQIRLACVRADSIKGFC
jgi:hypothetical protein